MKSILITGGNGFIAKNLYEQLHTHYAITSCTKHDLNLLDPIAVSQYLKKNFDIIIHTATYDAAPYHSTKDPSKVLEKNLKMFFNITNCSNHFDKLIYYGSGAEFDKNKWIPKMKEFYFGIHIPIYQYGFSKYIMNQFARSNPNIYNLRLFGVFGKYDDWKTRIISNICYHTLSNIPIRIIRNQTIDFLYIDDLVSITKHFIDNDPPLSTYNVCTGTTHTHKSIAEKILSISNKTLPINVEDDGIEYSGDNTRLLHEIPDFKFTPINTALQELYTHYKTNGMI